MLGAPWLLYSGAGTALCEKIKFINDVGAVERVREVEPDFLIKSAILECFFYTSFVQAREEGPISLIEFVMLECFCYTTFVVMNLHLNTWATGALVVGLGLGFFLGSVVCQVLADQCRKKLWNRLVNQSKESFKKASETSALHHEGQGECKDSLSGIHWSGVGLKNRDGLRLVLVADQVHRYLSIFCFGVAGVAAFSLLPSVVAAVYSVYMGALFLFQQAGLRIYLESSCLYHILNLTLSGGMLFVAMCQPGLLLFSCDFTQLVFIVLVSSDVFNSSSSLGKLLFGEGCFESLAETKLCKLFL